MEYDTVASEDANWVTDVTNVSLLVNQRANSDEVDHNLVACYGIQFSNSEGGTFSVPLYRYEVYALAEEIFNALGLER